MRRKLSYSVSRKCINGFTLVELLVVISIIALLLSVLMPSLSKARSTGRRLICGTHMHNMGLLIQTYAASNDGVYPLSYFGTDGYNSRGFIETLIIAGLINGKESVAGNDEWVMTDSSDRKAYSCPSFRRFLKVYGHLMPGWQNPDVISERYSIGYGYNTHLSMYNRFDPTTEKPCYDRSPFWGWYSYIGKNPPPSTLVLIDAAVFTVNNTAWSAFRPFYELTGDGRFARENGSIVGDHSGGKANSLWADMHVEVRRADEYSRRDSSDPSILLGKSVLDQKPHAYTDKAYRWSKPKGNIACAER